jgi:hypothetical protein
VPPAAAHYAGFVTHTLFLSLNDRQYIAPLERWKLTEAALAVMALVVGDDGGDSALGLQVAAELLAGKEALVKLLEVVSRAYQLLESEVQVDGAAADAALTGEGSALERGEEGLRAVEGSLSCGLQLLWALCRREDEWVERIRREGTRAYTLSALLFNHPQEVLVIAHATAHLALYPPSFAARVLAEAARGGQGEGGEGEGEGEEDERGVICYHAALLFHALSRIADSRLAHLLLASRLAPDISRAVGAQLRLTQMGVDGGKAEEGKAHLARVELVKTLVGSVGRVGGGRRRRAGWEG